MKIALYIEHGVGNGVGGAELMMAYLASAWSAQHDVDLVHHRPPLTKERLSAFCADDLSRVQIRAIPREPDSAAFLNPLRRYRAAQDWHRAASNGYDLFVNCTHWLPTFSHAKASALLVLFPFYVRPEDSPEMRTLPAWKRLRHTAYYGLEWRRRLATYQHRFAISKFTQEWTRRRWAAESDVVYPPVDVQLPSGPKENLVLSVGRFSTMAHTKKQLEMMQAFAGLHRDGLGSWKYASVGGLNTRDENRQYFSTVGALAATCGATVEANLDRTALRSLFASARIFWHATGLDEPTDDRPELCEHFGIATVEAMAAGCVPVVINKGGQSEIVRHGETGFLWNTVDELSHYTKVLTDDRALWQRMSDAARQRARDFSRERFIQEISRACNVSV